MIIVTTIRHRFDSSQEMRLGSDVILTWTVNTLFNVDEYGPDCLMTKVAHNDMANPP